MSVRTVIDVPAACSNLLAGRALVSMGLLTDMTVNERFTVGDLATNLGARVRVTVHVLWAAVGERHECLALCQRSQTPGTSDRRMPA